MSDGRVVYRTGAGRIRYCAQCGAMEDDCRCRDRARQPASDGFVRLARDRKRRGGKTVTLVTGVPGDQPALAALAQTLKRLCGSGGTLKDGVIELQGDHRDVVEGKLTALGYKVKRVGG